jgi:uncharacterized protein YutE (UPF0331/DUF86 family)
MTTLARFGPSGTTPGSPEDLVRDLARLPGFRDVLIHEYVALDMARVVAALDGLAPIRRFLAIVGGIEGAEPPTQM